MKADEYVELFHKEIAEGKPEKEVLVGILQKILEETQVIISKRKAISNSAMAACFDQQDLVWRAFCKRMPEKHIFQDAFARSVKNGNPKLFTVIVYEGRFKEYIHRQEMIEKISKKIKTL